MPSSLCLSLCLSLPLWTLAAASAPLTRPTSITNDLWTLSNIYIGCGTDQAKGGDFCSYEFDVEGRETETLPGFSARCYQQVAPGDEVLRQCYMTGGWSALIKGRSVESIDAIGTFWPAGGDARNDSRVVVQLTWYQEDSPSAGVTNIWRAEKTGQYDYFSETVPDPLELEPEYYQAVVIN